MSHAGRLYEQMRSHGVMVASVSVGVVTNKATWTVQPPNLQAAAQPFIDAFDPNDPAFAISDADAKTDALMDAISDDLLTAIAERMKATQNEVTAGTFQPRQWKQQIRGRVKALRRQK